MQGIQVHVVRANRRRAMRRMCVASCMSYGVSFEGFDYRVGNACQAEDPDCGIMAQSFDT